MLDKRQYVIEKTLRSTFLEAARDTYNVEDAYGNLLGYIKKQRLRLNFWFEGTDGTRMGEIRSSREGCEVYDAQNQLRATIKQKPAPPRKRRLFLLGGFLFLTGLLMAILGFIVHLTQSTTGFLEIGFLGTALTMFGIICLIPSYVRLEWKIEDREGRKLAEVKHFGKFFAEYQILTPDGGVIAQIQKKRGLAAFRYSYNINITSQVFDPLLVLSFTVCF